MDCKHCNGGVEKPHSWNDGVETHTFCSISCVNAYIYLKEDWELHKQYERSTKDISNSRVGDY